MKWLKTYKLFETSEKGLSKEELKSELEDILVVLKDNGLRTGVELGPGFPYIVITVGSDPFKNIEEGLFSWSYVEEYLQRCKECLSETNYQLKTIVLNYYPLKNIFSNYSLSRIKSKTFQLRSESKSFESKYSEFLSFMESLDKQKSKLYDLAFIFHHS